MEELIKLHSEVKQYCVYAHYYEDQLFYIGSGRVYRNGRGLRGRPFDFGGRSMEWFFFCNGEIDKVTVEILFVTNDVKLSLDKEEEITRYYMKLEMPLVNKNIGIKLGEKQKKRHSIIMSGKNNPYYGKRGKETSMYGKTHSAETRNKISLAMSGENHPMHGKKHSAETINKMREAQKGKKHSEETKRKLSENSSRSKKVLMINNEINEEKIFDSITKAYNFIVENGFDKTQRTLSDYLSKGSFLFNNYTFELTK